MAASLGSATVPWSRPRNSCAKTTPVKAVNKAAVHSTPANDESNFTFILHPQSNSHSLSACPPPAPAHADAQAWTLRPNATFTASKRLYSGYARSIVRLQSHVKRKISGYLEYGASSGKIQPSSALYSTSRWTVDTAAFRLQVVGIIARGCMEMEH